MTLLVGVLCRDGVVIGADSAATMGSLGTHTVRQPVAKVTIVNGEALFAVSGSVGLAQRLLGEFQDAYSEGKGIAGLGKPYKVGAHLRRTFWPHLEFEITVAARASQLIGQAAQSSAIALTMIAMPLQGRPHLFQFDQQGAPEEASADLPFVCLGSGQSLADPFMAFLRGILWEEGVLPTLAEGEFATIWTIKQAIDVAPAGIAGPIRVFVMEPTGTKWAARQVTDQELGEHLQAVDDVRHRLKEWRQVDNLVPPSPQP